MVSKDRQRLRGNYDDDFYWEHVDRNPGWLGDSAGEQRTRQVRLRDAVIGIVGVQPYFGHPPIGSHGRGRGSSA